MRASQVTKDFFTASLESINFQDGSFHKALTDEVERIRTAANPRKEFKGNKFQELTKKYTGMNVSYAVDEAHFLNAWTFVSQMDKNNPLLNADHAVWYGSDTKALLKKAKGAKLRGEIDLQKGRVSGVFAEQKTKLHLTSLLMYGKVLTSAEVSAIILHELGHNFTFYEYLGFTYRTNVLITTAAREFFGTSSREKRTVVLSEVLGGRAKDYDNLLELNSTEEGVTTFATVVMSVVLQDTRHELGNEVYSFRNYEQLSDDFSVRHGAGKDLAAAMHKLYSSHGDIELRSRTTNNLINASTAVLTAGLATVVATTAIAHLPLLAFVLVVNVLFSDPSDHIYDRSKERLETMRRIMTLRLKDESLEPEERTKLVDDIEQVNKIISLYTGTNRGLWELIALKIMPGRSKAAKQIDDEKRLEEMLANRLFITVSKIGA